MVTLLVFGMIFGWVIPTYLPDTKDYSPLAFSKMVTSVILGVGMVTDGHRTSLGGEIFLLGNLTYLTLSLMKLNKYHFNSTNLTIGNGSLKKPKSIMFVQPIDVLPNERLHHPLPINLPASSGDLRLLSR
ncbi:hypothetical protein Lalb_Chr01g0009741 [Lupinus albus]|uniref:Uncharacterized protein n=1 Tax=Lupinus albus TaxID=3870 RepID=A0A6A4R4U5_LUPAL|nr:hypothetical protein Lalb_Chr01g0009741 [Lupinus albus]